MSTKVAAFMVHPPEECARRLGGISVSMLIALLKGRGYAYTSLKPDSKPWGRGRQFWGMTDDQIAAVIHGQAKRHPKPTEMVQGGEVEKPKVVAGSIPGWDGKTRLRKLKTRQAK